MRCRELVLCINMTVYISLHPLDLGHDVRLGL